jgi:tetratricopeptide (TPR) repeat protein
MRAFLIACATILSITAAAASPPVDKLEACVNWSDMKRTEITCTDMIESRAYSGADLARLFVHRGAIRAKLGALQEASADLNNARGIDPASVAPHFWLGYVAMAAKQYENAIEYYDVYLAKIPDSPVARTNRAIALWSLGDTNGAFSELGQVTQSKPEYANAWFQRGVMLAGLGRIKPAMNDFKKAYDIEQSPQHTKCVCAAILAANDENLGKQDAAIESACRGKVFAKPAAAQ